VYRPAPARFSIPRAKRLAARLVLGSRPVTAASGLRFEFPPDEVGFKLAIRNGTYEPVERRLLERILRPGMDVLEIGGGLGVTSCEIAARIKPGRLAVVEPSPSSAECIRRNLRLNGLEATVLERAIAYGKDEVVLQSGFTALHNTLHVEGNGSNRVRASTVSQVVDELGWTPEVIVMDAEGAEFDFVEHDLARFAQRGVGVMIEVHPHFVTPERHAEFLNGIPRAGYALRAVHPDLAPLYHVIATPPAEAPEAARIDVDAGAARATDRPPRADARP
jgi:FkbM family methyltransferase